MPDPRRDEAGEESRVRQFCVLVSLHALGWWLAFLAVRALLLRLLDALF